MGRIDTVRRNRWISVVSRGNIVEKNIVESERVCDRYFVLGKLVVLWDKYDFGWVLILYFSKSEYKGNE